MGRGAQRDEAGPSSRAHILRPRELLNALHSHGVEFVVIGGFSLAAHGVIRGTKDVDIVPEPDRENLRRLATGLEELDAQVLGLEDFKPAEIESMDPKLEALAAGGNWLMTTRFGRLDVMQYVSGIEGYDELRAGAVRVEVSGVSSPTWFAGKDDLISMKLASRRDQDLQDIAALRAALD